MNSSDPNNTIPDSQNSLPSQTAFRSVLSQSAVHGTRSANRNWTDDEVLCLAQAKRLVWDLDAKNADQTRFLTSEQKWDAISLFLNENGYADRPGSTCSTKWDQIFRDWTAIGDFAPALADHSYFNMSRNERLQANLVPNFRKDLYDLMASFCLMRPVPLRNPRGPEVPPQSLSAQTLIDESCLGNPTYTELLNEAISPSVPASQSAIHGGRRRVKRNWTDDEVLCLVQAKKFEWELDAEYVDQRRLLTSEQKWDAVSWFLNQNGYAHRPGSRCTAKWNRIFCDWTAISGFAPVSADHPYFNMSRNDRLQANLVPNFRKDVYDLMASFCLKRPSAVSLRNPRGPEAPAQSLSAQTLIDESCLGNPTSTELLNEANPTAPGENVGGSTWQEETVS